MKNLVITIKVSAISFKQWKQSDMIRIQCKNKSYAIDAKDIIDFRVEIA